MIIKCPDCSKDISDKASSCIHCGYPLEIEPLNINNEVSDSENTTVVSKPTPKKSLLSQIVFLAIIIVIISSLIFACNSILSDDTDPNNPLGKPTCSYEGCKNKVNNFNLNGYCDYHIKRFNDWKNN